MTADPAPNPVREAMDLTAGVLAARVNRYRGLFLTIGPVIALPTVLAVVLFSWGPLLGVLLVIPMCGAFLWRDTVRVARWQQFIFGMWVEERIDLDVFRETALATPGPDPHLLNGMLATLPARKGAYVRVGPGTRRAVAAVALALARAHSARTGLAAVGQTVAVACLYAAAFAGVVWPLAGLIALPAAAWMGRRAFRLRVGRAARSVRTGTSSGFDPDRFTELIGQLDWGPLSAAWRDQTVASVSKSQ